MPSLRESPVSSFIAGTPAEANALEMISLRALCLEIQIGACLLLLLLLWTQK